VVKSRGAFFAFSRKLEVGGRKWCVAFCGENRPPLERSSSSGAKGTHNFSVCFHELLEFDGAVGGGGGGEFYGLDAGCCFAVLFVELVGGGACAKYALDFRMGEERGDVVGNHIFNACVACPNDGATVENVPEGNVVLQKHRFFLVDGRRERLV